MTDFIHLFSRPTAPPWFDILLLISFAGTGLLLAYGSVAGVQCEVERRFGTQASWCVAVSALFLSAFGIYLGRFLRWNSWDVFLAPLRLLSVMAQRAFEPSLHQRTMAITLLYGTGLVLGYLATRAIPSALPERR